MMSHVGDSSERRSQRQLVFGEETGLPLVMCPKCKMARVFERRSNKENENHGRVYFKCPRNITWAHDRCSYYNWQRAYLADLVKSKVVQMVFGEGDEELIEEEVQSMELQRSWRPAVAEGVVQSKAMEAKVDNLMKAVMFLIVLLVALVGFVVGYVLKK
ncbi:unnamed protein product [Urochloa humidicola]